MEQTALEQSKRLALVEKIKKTPDFARILGVITDLHGDVTYGDGLSMLDQILETAALVYEHASEDIQIIATKVALLHKCWEPKRIAEGKKALSLGDQNNQRSSNEVERIAGFAAGRLVKEIADEPEEDKGESKISIWKKKAAWAERLSPIARLVLLAEKVVNFETSRDHPNPKWSPQRHREYFKTRMIMVRALHRINSDLYKYAVHVQRSARVTTNPRLQERLKTRGK